MERVLRRVGLSKRPQQADGGGGGADGGGVAAAATAAASGAPRRRRRSRSRRRPPPAADAAKGGRCSLFRINWEAVRDCRSCRSRGITRRLCSRRTDNELYRSNSFKFERFIRGTDDVSTLSKQISLCDDYSLPVDHLSKRRPNSIAVPSSKFSTHFSDWNVVSSPNEEKVEVLDNYSTPRDSQQQLAEEDCDAKCFTSPDKEYSQPYTTDESSNPSSDSDFNQNHHHRKRTAPAPARAHQELNSPDSVAEGGAVEAEVEAEVEVEVAPAPAPAPAPSVLDALSPGRRAADVATPTPTPTPTPKRHPSPYYYGDLFKYGRVAEAEAEARAGPPPGPPPAARGKAPRRHHRNHRNHRNHGHEKAGRGRAAKQPNGQIRYRSSSIESHTSEDSNNVIEEHHHPEYSPTRQHVVNIIQVPSFDDGISEMTRQRHVYETAFDCQVTKSDDDLDQIEKVTNHPVLVQVNSEWTSQQGSNPSIASSTKYSRGRLKESEEKPGQNQEDGNTTIALSQELKNMHLAAIGEEKAAAAAAAAARGYAPSPPSPPSPPSTAPLPAKFAGKEPRPMNSIRSAPNLPLPTRPRRGRGDHDEPRVRDACCPHSVRPPPDKRIAEFKGRPKVVKEKIYDVKGRPKRDLLTIPKRAKDSMLRRIRHKYSSTESMTTSSSEGSMESIKSSTSEGNRSTSSSESRQSASLSSHSSDSGRNRPAAYSGPPTNYLAQSATNKLHILSPISDKSSQEPVSETSDNNRNNNSQKCSPEVMEASASTTEVKVKRRLPQNKNLLSLGLADRSRPEIQGSDSGISIQSREGIKPPRHGGGEGSSSAAASAGAGAGAGAGGHPDLSDLPFDMPKLRRRRAGGYGPAASDGGAGAGSGSGSGTFADAPCTSGSATSVDLRDLPFDMPKLRRRLRLQAAPAHAHAHAHAHAPAGLDDASPSRASSSQSVAADAADAADAAKHGADRPKLTLNFGEIGTRQRTGLGFTFAGVAINATSDGPLMTQCNSGNLYLSDSIDINLPLEKQVWFHGSITRVEAENVLRALREGSFLVRNSESIKNDFSLSLKSARGFMHMRIQKNSADGTFILGQFSKPFPSIPEMIRHFSLNRLPIRGAEHMCLLQPVIAQLL